MHTHSDIARKVMELIRNGRIKLAGNSRLKIFGQLSCQSGKRMKRENRVFFATVQEAVSHGYRPCGHCMKQDYLVWKMRKKQVEQES